MECFAQGKLLLPTPVTLVASEIEALLRHMSVSFTPGHDEQLVDFSRLSDGQKSMLYLSLVLSSQAIGRAVLADADDSFDADKLRPPVFTVVAVEEPENSLSPHYLGRIVNALSEMTSDRCSSTDRDPCAVDAPARRPGTYSLSAADPRADNSRYAYPAAICN